VRRPTLRRAWRPPTRGDAATALAVASCLVLVGATAAAAASGADRTRLTAHFHRAVGLYEGSSVRMLGVAVGKITKIRPEGTSVAVEMEVDGHKVPADSDATIVPPALVSDRYLQLSVFKGGPALRDGGDIPLARTQEPVEKDEILGSLDSLNVALGPQGANRNGSLSRLLDVGAKNLGGNGAQINQTLRDLTDLVSTLDDNKGELTGTVDQLNAFTSILLKNDGNIRRLYTDLSQVSQQLDNDRTALGAAFANLAVATKQIGDLARDIRPNLANGVAGLVDVTNVLVQEKKSLEELLDTAPLGLQNLSGAFNPASQTLDVRNNTPNADGNGLSLLLCTFLRTSPVPAAVGQQVCDASKAVPSPPSSGPPGGSRPPAVPTAPPSGLPALPLPGAQAGGTR